MLLVRHNHVERVDHSRGMLKMLSGKHLRDIGTISCYGNMSAFHRSINESTLDISSLLITAAESVQPVMMKCARLHKVTFRAHECQDEL